MTLLWKATRPNGTDFHSGRVRYEVGQTVHPEPTHRKPSLCGPGLLHASTEPAETLVGVGRWPCRLFRVEGEPVAQRAHKVGCLSLTVVEEVEAWQALGPNGREVAAVIERAGVLTEREVEGPHTDQHAARDAAGSAAWDAAGSAAWDAAGSAAWSAACALVVRDRISPEHFDALTAPWREVIGATWEETA